MPDPVGAISALTVPSLQDALNVKIVRGYLQNLDNGRSIEFLFNPLQFAESYRAQYASMDSPGLSHVPVHFVGLDNTKIPLTLMFDELVFLDRDSRNEKFSRSPARGAQNNVDLVRRKFLEIIYPRRARQIRAASPPAVNFYWPRMISMRCRVAALTFRHIQFFSGTPLPRIMAVDVELFEQPIDRIYSDEMVDGYGTFRPGASRGLDF